MTKKVWTPAARAAFAEKMRAARAAKGGKRKRRANPARAAVHTQKFDRTVRKVKRSLRKYHRKGNAYAIAENALGKKRSILKRHRRRNPSERYIIGIKTPRGMYFVSARGSKLMTNLRARANHYPTLGAAQAVGQRLANIAPRTYRFAVYRA